MSRLLTLRSLLDAWHRHTRQRESVDRIPVWFLMAQGDHVRPTDVLAAWQRELSEFRAPEPEPKPDRREYMADYRRRKKRGAQMRTYTRREG